LEPGKNGETPRKKTYQLVAEPTPSSKKIMLVELDHFPTDSGEIKKYLKKQAPSYHM